jgi:beta-aspartyl-dipeptidase (metallo-type)
MMLLIEGAEIFAPEPRGSQAVLAVAGVIARIGSVDRRAIEASGLPVEAIDATGCILTPGLIDPHEHLLGGSGEGGWATQTPELALGEIAASGITTVVGCLGTDTTTKTMPGLLAKAKAFNEEGITAYIYSGGYNVPPVTLTGSVRNDMMFVPEVIGAGEIAIADKRSTAPTLPELARLVQDAYVGGTLSGKAGVTHFHVGEGPERLKLLRGLLDEFAVEPPYLYPTHVERNEALMMEAIELTHRGVAVDVDTVEHDLPRWLRFFVDNGGDLQRLTVSSDAAVNSPRTLVEQLQSCVKQHGFAFEDVLPLFTSNTARVLKLDRKGQIKEGADADLVIWERDGMRVRDVIARGKPVVRNGRLCVTERFLKESNREVHFSGQRKEP